MIRKFIIFIAFGFLFALPVFASSNLGTLKESVAVGKTISIGLNPSSSGSWYIGPNSNSSVATGVVNSGALIITGKTAGVAQLTACIDVRSSDCLEVIVTVTKNGQVLGSSTEPAHAVKSWIISNKTVFYVASNGLIPVPTWKIFLNNGGKQSLLKPANLGDLALPLQSLMTLKDLRVIK